MKSDRRPAGRDHRRRFFGNDLGRTPREAGRRSVLVEGGGRTARGVAYSTPEPAHLLNVRAEGMSAWAGEPDHFARGSKREGGDAAGFAAAATVRPIPGRNAR